MITRDMNPKGSLGRNISKHDDCHSNLVNHHHLAKLDARYDDYEEPKANDKGDLAVHANWSHVKFDDNSYSDVNWT